MIRKQDRRTGHIYFELPNQRSDGSLALPLTRVNRGRRGNIRIRVDYDHRRSIVQGNDRKPKHED